MAKTVYVRKSGNDSNNGLTIATAKLTLAGANAIAVATDTVDIGQGNWAENSQIGKISNCTYTGAGRFLTSVTGDPIFLGYSIYLVSNMKIIITSLAAANNPYSRTSIFTNVHFDMAGMSPFGGISLFYLPLVNTVCKFDRCFFTDWSALTNNIFYNTGSNILKLYNCVFYNNGAAAIPGVYYSANTTTTTVIAKNCVFQKVAVGVNYAGSLFDTTGGLNVHDNNCYYNTYGLNPSSYLNPSEFIANPLFVDAAGGDFRLLETSPCIGKGTNNLP